MHPRIKRQINLALGLLDTLEPSLRPGTDIPLAVRRAISQIRGAGSRDRRFYREMAYTWFRYREWIDPLRSTEPDQAGPLLIALAHPTRETMPAKATLPEPLQQPTDLDIENLVDLLHAGDIPGRFDPKDLIPSWWAEECPAGATTSLPHTLPRPPIWLRRTRPSDPALTTELGEMGFPVEVSAALPGAISVPTDARIEDSPAYQSGRIEIQDIGSQAVLRQVAPGSGEAWLDACAGAGGKALQLAALVGPESRVVASDRRPQAIQELRKRARRSGITNVEALDSESLQTGAGTFDGVLVDAPCSGSGTWRRHPYLRHQTDPQAIKRHARKQLQLLKRFSRNVRPGGRLIYVTCSLCRRENQEVIEAFLREQPQFQPDKVSNRLDLIDAGPGQFLITPERFNGDAFFLANLRREG